MKNIVLFTLIFFLLVSCHKEISSGRNDHNLIFDSLPCSWDEGIPLGNGMNGVLIWEKEGKLRFSLDRADLWDLRPMGNIGTEDWKFSWVMDKWKSDQYVAVQQMFDAPYDQLPAPSKIPAAALEFDTGVLGEVRKVILDIENAVCTITWSGGAEMEIFIDAAGNEGWYCINSENMITPELVPPSYGVRQSSDSLKIPSNSLCRLGYSAGEIIKSQNTVRYRQEIWGGSRYCVSVGWNQEGKNGVGSWKIENSITGSDSEAEPYTDDNVPGRRGYDRALKEHKAWWKDFWSASSIALPDKVLEKQWYLEMYKFGSVARADAPPVSLQAVWTSDDGLLPPWKGDFHHDLNTELSYWPAYSSNHTGLSKGFTNWLSKYRATFEKYTRQYFEAEGLNVPGVTTLTGEPMGGWIQYSFGPTVSSWLAHHFYLQWRYTLDTLFLESEAYPWISGVAGYIEDFSVVGGDGKRKLPLSSSPEYMDNSREAWFSNTTNFDLSLVRWTFKAAAETAKILGNTSEAEHWQNCLEEWPDLAVDDSTGLMIAPGYPYKESHRHFSHLMSIHPLGLLDISSGEKEKEIITRSLKNLEEHGPDYWTGYSYAWLGNLYARAFKGDEASEALRTFAECFCLPNSFHVNGDQSGTGRSKFTYKPFTLEGNFAFASGIQEMLLQSHSGIIRVFPALPSSWKDVSFRTLRAEGAVLVSATMKKGAVTEVILTSEKGGTISLANPFGRKVPVSDKKLTLSNGIITLNPEPGETIVLKAGKKQIGS